MPVKCICGVYPHFYIYPKLRMQKLSCDECKTHTKYYALGEDEKAKKEFREIIAKRHKGKNERYGLDKILR